MFSNELPTFKAGVAKTSITPVNYMWMAGYSGRSHPSNGFIHDIWIKVLALESCEGNRAIILTSDLLGIPKNLYEDLISELRSIIGIDRSEIMFTASHNHSSPVVKDALQDCYNLDDEQLLLIDEYYNYLKLTIVDTVLKAIDNLTPALLFAGEGTATFAVNRRNNVETEVPYFIENGYDLKGPVDHEVPVLAIKTTDNNLLAVVFGYSCHATTYAGYSWFGDYPGYAQIYVEENYPGAVAMFYQKCGSDQNPIPRGSIELSMEYGKLLAESVESVLLNPMRQIDPYINTSFEFVNLYYGTQPTISDLKILSKRDDILGRWAKRLLKVLEGIGRFPTYYEYPVQVWRLGKDQIWISLGGEIPVDYANYFKNKYRFHTWVNGYANDVMAYIPSKTIWEEGGYETGALPVYGLPAYRWAPDVEDPILASVNKLIQNVNYSDDRKLFANFMNSILLLMGNFYWMF
ncbi:MAG: neutral/alkaline non-lysosomal ceramidase N-terminal domain-containing protein [Desulfobacterales bacterium]|nr:neutral/alkaline non-lysosomal ceramidase N-terminal domain-containing protein [Desulfobacterales bacterium]